MYVDISVSLQQFLSHNHIRFQTTSKLTYQRKLEGCTHSQRSLKKQEWYITSSLAFSSSVFVFLFVCCCVITIFSERSNQLCFLFSFLFLEIFLIDFFLDLIFQTTRARKISSIFSKTLFVTVTYILARKFCELLFFFSLITQCEKSAKK